MSCQLIPNRVGAHVAFNGRSLMRRLAKIVFEQAMWRVAAFALVFSGLWIVVLLAWCFVVLCPSKDREPIEIVMPRSRRRHFQ